MKKGEAKSYSKNVYTVIDVPTREEGGKQITAKNRADPQEDFLQVAEGGSGRRRSQCQGDGRGEGQTKGKREKVGEARSAMSKEGLTLPVVQPKGRTLCGERARRRCPARTWLSARPLPPPKAKG